MGSEWKEVQLQQLVSKLGDGLHGTPEYSETGAYYFINGNNLENGRIVLKSDTKRVSSDEFEKHKKELNSRTLLVSINGTIGNVAYYENEPIILGKSACYFNLKEDVSRGFVRQVISSSAFQQYLESHSTGTTIKNVSLKQMREFTFRLPLLPEQKAIAHILGSLDDKIELNRRMNETLEGMAQALFKSWFVDFDPVIDNALVAGNPIPEELADRAEIRRAALANGTANREAAKPFPAGFQQTEEMGWIPFGWEIQPLYNMANFINGASFKESDFSDAPEALPVVKIAEVKNGILEQTKFTNTQKEDKYKIKDGEILLSWSGNPDTSIDTFLWTDGDGWLNQHIFKVVLKDDFEFFFERCFVFYQLKTLRSVFAEIARDKQTTGLGHFTVGDMKRLFVFKLDASLLAQFNNITEAIYKRYYENRLSQNALTKLRDTLLPKLISGELRIPDAEKLAEAALA